MSEERPTVFSQSETLRVNYCVFGFAEIYFMCRVLKRVFKVKKHIILLDNKDDNPMQSNSYTSCISVNNILTPALTPSSWTWKQSNWNKRWYFSIHILFSYSYFFKKDLCLILMFHLCFLYNKNIKNIDSL